MSQAFFFFFLAVSGAGGVVVAVTPQKVSILAHDLATNVAIAVQNPLPFK